MTNADHFKLILYFFYHGAIAPSGPMPPHCRGFIITLRHITLGRTSLDDWSARRRDLYLTTHNTYKSQTSMPRRDSNPQFSKRAAADPRLRPRGQWDRHYVVLLEQHLRLLSITNDKERNFFLRAVVNVGHVYVLTPTILIQNCNLKFLPWIGPVKYFCAFWQRCQYLRLYGLE